MERELVIGLIALVLAAYLVSGICYAAYRPVVSNKYLWAVYHVHSTISDGLGSVAEIASQARKARVALIILTDHGNPNRAASAFRLTVNGVAIVGGSEVKLPDGRLTFFGAAENPGLSLASSGPQAIDKTRLSGAFPIISYSEDSLYGWRYWESDLNPDGIEISNLFSSLRGLSVFGGFLLALYYPFSPYYFLKSISFPAQSLSRWDEFLARRKTWGLSQRMHTADSTSPNGLRYLSLRMRRLFLLPDWASLGNMLQNRRSRFVMVIFSIAFEERVNHFFSISSPPPAL